MNEIILTAKSELKDNELREWFSVMQRRMEVFNDRTKKQTREIAELRKQVELIKKYIGGLK